MKTIWGGVVPLHIGTEVEEPVLAWAKASRVRRPFLVLDPGARLPSGRSVGDLVHSLEASGLAAFAFEVPEYGSLDAVGQGLGQLHFEASDGVVAVGGARAIDLAKTIAFMSAQTHPPAAIAADPTLINRSVPMPSAAIAVDLAGVAALGGAVFLADDAGTPFFLRDEALRPSVAALVPARPALTELDRRLVASLLIDAGQAFPEQGESILVLVETLLAGTGEAPHAEVAEAALTAAGVLERCPGPGRAVATFAAAAGGGSFRDVMLDVAMSVIPGRSPELSGLAERLAARSKGDGSTLRTALGSVPLDTLTRVTLASHVLDLGTWLAALGFSLPATRRRGGRRARLGE